MSTLLTQRNDYFLSVANGQIPGETAIFIDGDNSDIDTAAAEDLFFTTAAVAVLTPPTAARIHAIVSSVATDSLAGTGAQKVMVEGLDVSYNAIFEVVNMNGTTPVNTVNSYTFINKLIVTQVGSGGVNAGNITATAAVDGTISCAIRANAGNISSNCFYMVPDGYSLFILGGAASIQSAIGGTFAEMVLLIKEFGASTPYVQGGHLDLNIQSTSSIERNFKPYAKVNSKAIVKVRASTTSNNTDASATLYGILKQN